MHTTQYLHRSQQLLLTTYMFLESFFEMLVKFLSSLLTFDQKKGPW